MPINRTAVIARLSPQAKLAKESWVLDKAIVGIILSKQQTKGPDLSFCCSNKLTKGFLIDWLIFQQIDKPTFTGSIICNLHSITHLDNLADYFSICNFSDDTLVPTDHDLNILLHGSKAFTVNG